MGRRSQVQCAVAEARGLFAHVAMIQAVATQTPRLIDRQLIEPLMPSVAAVLDAFPAGTTGDGAWKRFQLHAFPVAAGELEISAHARLVVVAASLADSLRAAVVAQPLTGTVLADQWPKIVAGWWKRLQHAELLDFLGAGTRKDVMRVSTALAQEAQAAAPPTAADHVAKPRKGRPPADEDTIDAEADLAAEWQVAHQGGAYKPDFSRMHRMSLKQFDNLLARVRGRKRQAKKPARTKSARTRKS